MTLSGYTAGSLPRYRIYNGSYQYAPWNADTGAFVTSTSYSAGPLVPGDYVSGTTFWILCQRNNNASVTATYRDRLTSYTSNNNTVALPGATAISSPFTLNGTLVGGSCSYGLDVRYVILGFDSTSGGTLLCTSFSDVTTGSFSLVCHGGHTIRRVEVRTIDNTTITAATQTGTWTATTALGNVNLCVSTVAPTVTSTAAGGIGAGGATLGGNVTADGGATVTDRGVCYKTSSGVTISDNKTSIGTGTGVFSQGITGLGVNTRYYFNAFAINSAGTSWGTELNFWTLANVPGAPSVSNPTTSSLNVGINENGNPATTSFAIYETTQNKWVQADGSLGASAVWQTKAQWGTKTVTGLSAGTQYTFQVKARNGANVETIASGTTSGTTLAAGCSSFWHALYNQGTPLATYYLGDKLTNQFEFAISQDTTGWTVEYGLGTTTSGSGWAWRAAEWYRQVDDNREWKSKANEHQFTSVGNWYYAGQFITGGCIYYADTGWEATTGGGLSAGSYFTVNALNDPGNQSATAAGTTSISLGWAKNGQGHDVMIVRSTDSNFTAPTGGTTYTPGSSTIGGDLVVYRGGNTSFTDTGLDPSTTYYYKFYSENWSYYSVGVTASATTHTPTPTIVLADNGTQVAAGNVAAGTTAHVLSSFKVTVSVTTAKLTKVAFTTAGTYQTADISNLKLRYSTDATLDTGDATRWGSTTLERANPLRLVRPWRNEPGFRGGEFQYSIFNIQCPISTVQVAGVISHAKPPAFAKATVGKPRREGESWQGCLARLFDQRSTTNNQRPLPPTNFNCALNG